jgi:hypothetical protein
MKRYVATIWPVLCLAAWGVEGCSGCDSGGKSDADALEEEELVQDPDVAEGELDGADDPAVDGQGAETVDEVEEVDDGLDAGDVETPDAEDAMEEELYPANPCTKVGGDIRITEAPYSSWIQSLVWSGSEYALAWEDSREGTSSSTVYFVRLDSAGGKLAGEYRIPDEAGLTGAPSLVWTGSEYAVVWTKDSDVLFARISAAGDKIGGDVLVAGECTGAERNPSLAWTGSEYAVAWRDMRNDEEELYFARLDASGTVPGEEIRLFDDPDHYNRSPDLVLAEGELAVAWFEGRNLYPPEPSEIYFARLDFSGAFIGSEVMITNNSYSDLDPALVWTGSEYGLAWDGGLGRDIGRFARLDSSGTVLGSGTLVTDESDYADSESHVWTGSEYAFVWDDYRDGNHEIYFGRKSALGEKTEGDLRVTDNGADSFHPSLAWTGSEFGVVWSDGRVESSNSELFFTRISCP